MGKLHKKLVFYLSLVLVLLLVPGVGFTDMSMKSMKRHHTKSRPISDFVERQGAFCLRDDFSGGVYTDTGTREGSCTINNVLLIVPPVKNFLGQTDPAANLEASVDYAGLSDDVLGFLNTKFKGRVEERALRDGRALVTVNLKTENALTYVFEGDDSEDFPTTILGNRVSDVQAGEETVLGESKLKIVFTNTAPGAPLPDLIQLFFFPEEGQVVKSYRFSAKAKGSLAEGGKGKFTTKQVCPVPCSPEFVFSQEKISLSSGKRR